MSACCPVGLTRMCSALRKDFGFQEGRRGHIAAINPNQKREGVPTHETEDLECRSPQGHPLTALPSPHAMADWLALLSEEVLEPDLPIIDAHHHLWDRPASRYLLDEFLADINSGHRIVATVYLQCFAMHRMAGPLAQRPVGETEFANGIAAMSASGLYGQTRICEAIVSYVDLRLGEEAERALDLHAAHGGSRFKGIRQITAWDKNPDAVNPENMASQGMLSDPRFRAGFATLNPRGLSFDAFLFHNQLEELIDLARAFPSTRIVLNHLGAPLGIAGYEKRRAEVLREWALSMKQLSTCENVFVKLGGMGLRPVGMGFAAHPAPLSSERLAELMRPFVHPCIEYFGARRCMFESNFPIDKSSYSYRTCWNTFKRLASGASEGEKRFLFHDTAATVYGLRNL